jgi:CHAT domain-containing protein
MRSAIVLGSGNGQDGVLQAREIFRLPLNADLVVLSACRTAAGRASAAEGMQSLARAFLYAGARSVLGTLWDVDDRLTAGVMDRFYEQAARGEPEAEALRRAQLEVMGRSPYRTAPVWAAFVMSGDGALKIRIRPAPRMATAALSAAALASGVLLAFALLYRRRTTGAVTGV